MKLVVSEQVAALFPALRIAVVLARDVDNTGTAPALEQEIRAAEAAFRADFPDGKSLGLDRRIEAWRDAYRSFGAKPKRHRPSAEALLSRVLKGDPLPSINKAVDAYLLSELTFLLPVGGYDRERLRGDIHLRLSAGDEAFVGIGGAHETTDDGEVVYADDSAILTRRWNYRDCDHAKIEQTSRDILLFVEAPSEQVTTEEIEANARFIAARIEAHCGASARCLLLDTARERAVELTD